MKQRGVTRRALVCKAAGSLAAGLFESDAADAATPSYARNPADLLELDAVAAAALIRQRRLSAETYTTELIRRSRQLQPLRAWITLDDEAALSAARAIDTRMRDGQAHGPLAGVPIAIKDTISTRGLKTSYGTAVLRNFKPGADAAVIAALRKAGAIVLGKTNCQELAFGSNGYNAHHGQTLNPYDPSRITGGSSGGSALVAAARGAPIALGGDTAASIRVPAALCGLVGFRPSTGRYSTAGVAPQAPTLDTVGPLCRSVRDAALIDAILSAQTAPVAPRSPRGIRLAVPRGYFFDGLDQELSQVVEDYLSKLRDAGVTLIEREIDALGAVTDKHLVNILMYETYPSLSAFLAEARTGITIDELARAVGPDVRSFWEALVLPAAPGRPSPRRYQAALAEREKAKALVAAYFADTQADAWILPATIAPATPVEPASKQNADATIIVNGRTVSLFDNDRNGSAAALVGMPSLTLPIGRVASGLPVAIGIDGLPGHDRELLAVGAALESLAGKMPGPKL